jgi:membrane fusion protein (multidrug efflux system)
VAEDQPPDDGDDEDQPKAGDPHSDGDEDPPGKPNPLKNPKVLVIGAAVLILLLVGGLLYWLHARQYQSTDDAFVDTHIVRLAPQVPGQVVRVLVADNALVRAGQPLIEIDASSARAALMRARAQQGEADAQLTQARAQIGISEAGRRQAEDQAAGLAAQAEAAARDARRLTGLQAANPRAVAQQQVDQAVAQARSTAAQRNAARNQAAGAAAQVRASETGVQTALASLRSARAAIAENELTVERTRVVAPVDGYVTRKSVAVGAYVQPGQQLLALVPRQMWVTANFKETQLKSMRPGQPVDLKIDACPARLQGKVISIQRGAGQAFALLPSENATGNFVKVVQRVPVKISFDSLPPDCPLGPGLSVRPRVKVR